jgi:DNA polymerase I-like protein with 3'-5' exonuclease and polymerase domains
MGTVTGRILVSEPFLQQLRRRFRGVVEADSGKILIYLDYRQFEPGIMADLSGDPQFIEAYNSADLYSSLSQAVFEDEDHRSLCKRVFLSFCYGMPRSGLATLLLGKSPENGERETLEAKLQQFFDRYPGLEKLRSDLQHRLRQDGFVASLWGNRRYRLASGVLTPEERRWSLSQRIQGTAALIFKEALVDIADTLGPECIVLPMHDAILLQFPSSNAVESKAMAANIMAAKFQTRCPAITPKISDEPFAL